MNISGVTRTHGVYQPTVARSTERKSRTEGKASAFELSSSAKDYQTIRNALSNIPDIRQDKLDNIAKKMDSGSYNVKSSDVADKLTAALFSY